MHDLKRIAIVISHPIQHFCPQYVSFNENPNITLKVFFASTLGFKKYKDLNFNQEISWGNLNLDKFDHIFLNGEALLQSDKNLDAQSLENELSLFKPDVLISYGYFQKVQRRAQNWANKNKVHLVFISDSELKHSRNNFKEFIKFLYLKFYFLKIDSFLSVGNANEAFYKHYGVKEKNILRMHFPIDIKQYQKSYLNKESLRNTIREKYSIKENEILLLMVGKLVKWKNHDHIIDAMILLEKEGISVNLIILGSGEMKNIWEQKATHLKISKVFFPGFVSIEELPAYYAASDMYVHSASLEPHSIAISEAISMGCPIILSDKCGSYGETDDVQEGKNGYVFKFGDITELAQKIKTLAEDKNKRIAFGNYSHQISKEFQKNAHYTIVENLIELSENIN